MELIDERGRLFGRVNVVDALVVVLALALVVAGIAVVTSAPADQDDRTRYATVALAEQPPEVAALVEAGAVEVAGSDAEITDTYPVPDDGSVRTFVRVRLRGEVRDGEFRVANRVIRVGERIRIESNTSGQRGTVLAVAERGDSLPVETRRVTLSATVPASVASAVEDGDEYRVAGGTLGRVESVTVRNASGDRRHVEVDLALRTLRRTEGPEFAGQPVRPGATLAFATDEYELEGTVTAVR